MTTKKINPTPSAYNYPLLIKNILNTPLIYSPDQEIVYRDKLRYSYVTLYKRIKKLANMLETLGVKPGDTVAVMDWDSHRYLECFFAVPMMGAVLHTGDIGVIDTEGYLRITDRLKDVIKTGGEWVSSIEIEDIISQHEAVNEVAVVGIIDEKWGERPLAIVMLKDEFQNKVTEKDIQDFCMTFVEKGVIPKYGIPSKIVLNGEIPKTSVGKISKKDIRSQYN